MTSPTEADRYAKDDTVAEIRSILRESPELLNTLPPVERTVAEELMEC